jgi:hypothetical protein
MPFPLMRRSRRPGRFNAFEIRILTRGSHGFPWLFGCVLRFSFRISQNRTRCLSSEPNLSMFSPDTVIPNFVTHIKKGSDAGFRAEFRPWFLWIPAQAQISTEHYNRTPWGIFNPFARNANTQNLSILKFNNTLAPYKTCVTSYHCFCTLV